VSPPFPIGTSRRTHRRVMRAPEDRARGSVAVELVLVVPLFVVLLLAIAHGGRVLHAQTQVRAVAGEAARAASLARTPAEAARAAQSAAATARPAGGLGCRSLGVELDASGFRPGGQVAVTVRCQASLSDLGLLGVPGSRSLSARSVEVIDQWRAG
jgi:Flp pilus assembly protein TadG